MPISKRVTSVARHCTSTAPLQMIIPYYLSHLFTLLINKSVCDEHTTGAWVLIQVTQKKALNGKLYNREARCFFLMSSFQNSSSFISWCNCLF